MARDISKGVAGEFNATRNRNNANIQTQREAKMDTGEVIFALLIFMNPILHAAWSDNHTLTYKSNNIILVKIQFLAYLPKILA